MTPNFTGGETTFNGRTYSVIGLNGFLYEAAVKVVVTRVFGCVAHCEGKRVLKRTGPTARALAAQFGLKVA